MEEPSNNKVKNSTMGINNNKSNHNKTSNGPLTILYVHQKPQRENKSSNNDNNNNNNNNFVSGQ